MTEKNRTQDLQEICRFLEEYCPDRNKMSQGCKNPIAAGDFKWIFACNCEDTEQHE